MKLNRVSKIVLSLSIVGWLIIGFLIFNSVNVEAKDNIKTNIYKKLKLFNEVLFKVKENYVEEVDLEEMFDAAIEGMLDETDPHTNYFTPDEFKRFTTNTKGEFGGLGISIDKRGQYITVVAPIEGTPAYRMGILAGDKIIKVDGESIVGVDTDESIKLMRGEPGTNVVITIKRPGVKDELDFDIERDIIKIESIPYAFKLDNGIGYIRIRQFNSNTSKELREHLDELEEKGIRGLLIDLRFNPGGLLQEAINTVNEFIGKDKLVVFTKGRAKGTNREHFTRYNRQRTGYPVVVLINEGSASASEIFAGSMQDWDRGLVVGKTSFGKGSVQRLFPLSEGNGIKITTAKYYIHSGRCIHKDLNDQLLTDERVQNGDISKKEIDEMKDKAEKESKEKIYYTEKGRIVYGGGGITPDVEISQSRLNDLEIEMRRKNVFFDYSVKYLLDHEEIRKNFTVSNELVDNFLTYVEEDDIQYEQTTLDSSMIWIKNQIKSNIIGRKYGDEERYKITLDEDTQLQEAIALFDKYPSLELMFEYSQQISEETEENN